MSPLPFLTWFRWKHIGDISIISLRSSLFPTVLVHFLNSWYLLVHCSSSNIFFKIAKSLFKGGGETVKFVPGPRIWLLVHIKPLDYMWDHIKIVLESINLQFSPSPHGKLQWGQFNEALAIEYSFCQNIWILSRDTVQESRYYSVPIK